MSTFIHAGNGAKRSARHTAALPPIVWRLGVLLVAAFLTSPSVAAEAPADPSAWHEVGSYTLAPGTTRIISLQQSGPDLVVQVRYSDGSTYAQDSRDSRFGTEVVLLENTGTAPLTAELAVRARASGLVPSWQSSELINPDARDLRLAANMAQASRLVALQHSDDESARALWADLTPADRGSPLFVTACVQYIQTLLGNFDFSGILDALASLAPQAQSDSDTRVYLGWVEAISYWQLRDIDTALVKFTELKALLTEFPEISSTGRFLDRQHIHANHGATVVNAGVRTGDAVLMQQGAAMIDTALANTAAYPDYALLGELHNFVSGYSTMLYNRIDEDGSKALDLAEHYYALAQDPDSLAAIKNNKAFILLGKGRIGEAQALYREALLIAADTRHYSEYAFYLARLAFTYLATGDYKRAEALYLEAIALMRNLRLDRVAAASQIELGTVYHLQMRYAEAIAHYQNLLSGSADDSWVEESLQIRTGLARNYLASGDLDSAWEQAALGAFYMDRVNRLDYRLDHQSVNAALLLAEGRHAEAVALIEVTLAELEAEFQETEQQLELYRLLAKAYFDSGDFPQALQAGERALALVANTRNQLDINQQGAMWGARTDAITSQHVEHLLTLYASGGDPQHLDAAFENMQRSRALSLRQARMLSATSAAQEQSEQLVRLWNQMNAANQALLAAAIQGQPLHELEAELLSRQEAYRNVVATVTPAQLPGTDATLTLEQIQQRLEPGTLALSFHVTPTSAWRLAVSATSVDVQRFDNVEELASMADAFLAAMDVNKPADLSAFGALGALAFPDITNAQRLIIESDAWLVKLPFAALPMPGTRGYDPAVNHVSSIQASSLSSYFISRLSSPERATTGNSVVIFADPVFTELDTALADTPTPAARGLRAGLEQLPFTRLEADAIMTRFSAHSPRVYTGSDASIPNLLSEENRSAAILHIATHGFANTSGRSLSGLALAAAPEHASGLLTIEEISRHVFSNQLIVISGCETGQGEYLDGEGVMSIARAFMAQGAKAVIATLWPISDRATASFMSHFYTALLDTNDAAAALQSAQRQLASSPDYRHPWYWSGFVLNVADASARPLTTDPAPTLAGQAATQR